MALELVALCGVDLTLGTPRAVGHGPSGHRIVAPVTRMTFTGERLRGDLVEPAADWLTIAGGIATIDVRAVMQTDDGAVVYVEYSGRSDASSGMGAAPVYVAARFEVGDERYHWLNAVQAVGRGDMSTLHYDWYEVR